MWYRWWNHHHQVPYPMSSLAGLHIVKALCTLHWCDTTVTNISCILHRVGVTPTLSHSQDTKHRSMLFSKIIINLLTHLYRTVPVSCILQKVGVATPPPLWYRQLGSAHAILYIINLLTHLSRTVRITKGVLHLTDGWCVTPSTYKRLGLIPAII